MGGLIILLVLISIGGGLIFNVLPPLLKIAEFLACLIAFIAIVWGLFATGNAMLGLGVLGFFFVCLKGAIG